MMTKILKGIVKYDEYDGWYIKFDNDLNLSDEFMYSVGELEQLLNTDLSKGDEIEIIISKQDEDSMSSVIYDLIQAIEKFDDAILEEDKKRAWDEINLIKETLKVGLERWW